MKALVIPTWDDLLNNGSNIVPLTVSKLIVISLLGTTLTLVAFFLKCMDLFNLEEIFLYLLPDMEGYTSNKLPYFKLVVPHFLVIGMDHSLLVQQPTNKLRLVIFFNQRQLFQTGFHPFIILDIAFNSDPKRRNFDFSGITASLPYTNK